jgi:glycosyltransferase involved in cell wall biosynthesis
MFLPQGTGIATYASSLATESTEWLVAGRLQGLTQLRPVRYGRAFVARWRNLPTKVAGNLRIADDAFRVAQVHFDLFGRLLVLDGPCLPDVMHWTSPLPLRLAGVPNLYTILDTIPLDHQTRTNKRRFHRILQAIAASADHIITLSEAARGDILRWLPGLAGRISVVPPAVTVAPLPDLALADVLERYQLEMRGYYLFVGTIEPRKNVAALVRAFLAAHPTRMLVLAGPDGWQSQHELAECNDALKTRRIRRLPYLPRTDVTGLIQGAQALLFPSLAEGFGLPIIEAMALGTPVLTSRGGATEEAAGDAALLVDPKNGAELQAGISALDTDIVLTAELSALGAVRASQFGLERQTVCMSALYASLLQTF